MGVERVCDRVEKAAQAVLGVELREALRRQLVAVRELLAGLFGAGARSDVVGELKLDQLAPQLVALGGGAGTRPLVRVNLEAHRAVEGELGIADEGLHEGLGLAVARKDLLVQGVEVVAA